jgi:hypothetical protein
MKGLRRCVLWVLLLILFASHPAISQDSHTNSADQAASYKVPTVEQFREYLKLSGVGEIWRAGWIAALDANRHLGEPYWPESFWTDVREAMQAKDLAPTVFEVYRYTYSYQTMDKVNALLAKGGRAAYLASPVGSAFCAQWAMKEEQGKQANLAMTQALLEVAYQRHKPEIKAARAKYLAEHPDWKD